MADDSGPSEDEVRDAFATLLGVWNQIAGSVSEAVRDPETREQLKKAATAFATAVGTTIADLATEFSTGPNTPGDEEE